MSPNLSPFLPSLAGAFECDNDYYESFIYSPTDALKSCLKKTILKFTFEFILKLL